MTHNELNAVAVRWLKRPESANGPGCQVALTEVGGLYGGERADAFGYRCPFWQHTADLRFELDMLAHALVRFGDPEETKTLVREAHRVQNRLTKEINEQKEKLKQYSHDRYLLHLYQERYGVILN